MSVQITKDTVHLPDSGLLIMDAMLVLRDAARHKPESTSAVWLVLEGPDGGLCWEQGEWRPGSELWDEGWYLTGFEKPLTDQDYKVHFWCHEPPLPPRPDTAPVADTGGSSEGT